MRGNTRGVCENAGPARVRALAPSCWKRSLDSHRDCLKVQNLACSGPIHSLPSNPGETAKLSLKTNTVQP